MLKAGILVIIPAGNGSENLDYDTESASYEEYRNRPDNGIIRVGAGNKKTLATLDFSTFDSLIHLQGWGEDVVTTGYGDLYNSDLNNNYTNTFGGTSSLHPP
ncbi:MAG: hypothetical protein AB8W37_03835 [Arsenophonus endosymbiont of Dermacentor nuttalli]